MKKLSVFIVAAICTACLSSCMGSAPMGNKNTTDPKVKANEAYAMTAEKAAGLYKLDSMDNLGETTKDSYKTNTVRLNADGTFELNIAVGEMVTEDKGNYTIGVNGIITFDNSDFSIIADGETVVCNGSELTAEGQLGRSVITMNYVKVDEEAEVEEKAQAENIQTEETEKAE